MKKACNKDHPLVVSDGRRCIACAYREALEKVIAELEDANKRLAAFQDEAQRSIEKSR